MKTLFSGVKPTGTLHIGNYFGAMKQFVVLAYEYNSFFMIADYHTINFLRDPEVLRANIFDIAVAYLAIGLDPKRVTLFQQSLVPEHTEMTWIFNSLVPVSLLMQAHAYKDAVANGRDANMGLFDYPMLMASDILLYDADVVPVGKDQQQHVEYAREAAAKFNNTYGELFKEPQAIIQEEVAVVPGTDGRKMSKSYGNTIPLFGTRDEIAKAVMSIVTDSSGDVPHNVYAIHKLLKTEDDLDLLYQANKGKYKNLKDALIEDLDALIAPMREKRDAFIKDPSSVNAIIREGSEKARSVASAKMTIARQKVGVANL